MIDCMCIELLLILVPARAGKEAAQELYDGPEIVRGAEEDEDVADGQGQGAQDALEQAGADAAEAHDAQEENVVGGRPFAGLPALLVAEPS